MEKALTPMQKQYVELKEKYPDAMLFFRLGDFYEVFGDDAIKASQILGLTLTGRGKEETRIPMAGIPHHALPNYMPKLVEAGIKVAIADQTEEAVPGKLVERKVTKIITPGTVLDEKSLDSSKNNYIASVYIKQIKDSGIFNLAFCDLTTGELRVFKTNNALTFKNELKKINPAEVLSSENDIEKLKLIYSGFIQKVETSKFDLEKCFDILKLQLNVINLKGFGIEDDDELLIPAGVLIDYLKDNQKTNLNHIKSIAIYNHSNYMQLDESTIRNLELLYPANFSGDQSATLFSVVCFCMSAMGKRKLRHTILNPLVNEEMLIDRLDAVEFFYDDQILISDTREKLGEIFDIERINGKIGLNIANPKDLIALKNSLKAFLELVYSVQQKEEMPVRVNYLVKSQFAKVQELINLIETTISEDAPLVTNEGWIFTQNYHSEIDELRSLQTDSKKILAEIQSREVTRTGITSLKISFNQVFGYYIEVTRTHVDKVPADYIRKQTLANAERYITGELKELEEKILNSEEKLIKLEQTMFFEFISKLSEYINEIKDVAERIAEIDLLSNFAFVARKNGYTKPMIEQKPHRPADTSPLIKGEEGRGSSLYNLLSITAGRHPVVEKIVEEFTANDTEFGEECSIHLLTGPNMSGKSTYIRQVALITLMAQIGSFVPADLVKLSLVDRIFTRVGASDNLSRGESTFMVEMIETANILNNATENSLIILDEVGRGTSTYDGVAIAWSIVEFIHKNLKCKTLFATHYHELTELEQSYKLIKNYNVEVSEENGEIVFEHKIVKGAASKSYGVHVAKLAGVPNEVSERAEEILKRFEIKTSDNKDQIIEKSGTSKSQTSKPKTPARPKRISPEQLGLL